MDGGKSGVRRFRRPLVLADCLRLGLLRNLVLRGPVSLHSLRLLFALSGSEFAAFLFRRLRWLDSDAWRCTIQGIIRRSSPALGRPLKNLDSVVQLVSFPQSKEQRFVRSASSESYHERDANPSDCTHVKNLNRTTLDLAAPDHHHRAAGSTEFVCKAVTQTFGG